MPRWPVLPAASIVIVSPNCAVATPVAELPASPLTADQAFRTPMLAEAAACAASRLPTKPGVLLTDCTSAWAEDDSVGLLWVSVWLAPGKIGWQQLPTVVVAWA